jgi:hypothetical protein
MRSQTLAFVFWFVCSWISQAASCQEDKRYEERAYPIAKLDVCSGWLLMDGTVMNPGMMVEYRCGFSILRLTNPLFLFLSLSFSFPLSLASQPQASNQSNE